MYVDIGMTGMLTAYTNLRCYNVKIFRIFT